LICLAPQFSHIAGLAIAQRCRDAIGVRPAAPHRAEGACSQPVLQTASWGETREKQKADRRIEGRSLTTAGPQKTCGSSTPQAAGHKEGVSTDLVEAPVILAPLSVAACEMKSGSSLERYGGDQAQQQPLASRNSAASSECCKTGRWLRHDCRAPPVASASADCPPSRKGRQGMPHAERS